MHPKNRTQYRAARLLAPTLALFLTAFASNANAQGNATPTNGDSETEEVVVLSPFEVTTEQDYGYRASNSIAGTRTNTPIKDIPLNIQVFTEEFVQDLNIKNQVDMEAYNASLVYGAADRRSDNPIQQPYQNFLFRGFRQNWGLRDGIREYDPIDAQGLERVEVVKGPVAALYGLSYPGGVMQNISKTVKFGRDFAHTRFTVGGEGDYRATIDANASTELGSSKFGVRVNGVYEKTKDERAHSEGAIRYQQIVASWLPTESTQAELLIEDGFRSKPNGLAPYFFQAGAGNSSVPLQILRPNIPWNWNWANSENQNTLDTELYRGTLTQNFGENFFVRGYYQYSTRLEIPGNGWNANGADGVNSWEHGGGWDTATDMIRMTYHYRDWGNKMHAYGATAVYKFDLGDVKNTFSFGASVWQEDELSRSSDPIGGPNSPTTQVIAFPVRTGIKIDVPPYMPSDIISGATTGGPFGNSYHHENNSNDYYFANWQAYALENRLKVNVGINQTNLKLVTWNSGASTLPENTFEDDKVSPLFGAMYDITPEISIFGVRAESLFPDSTKDSFGNQFPPIVGTSNEFGFKFDIREGMLSGTVTYFNIEQEGGTQQVAPHENRNTQIWDSLTTRAARDAAFPGLIGLSDADARQSLLNQGDIVEGGKAESSGFEFDIIYQPIKNWQIVLSYANIDHEFEGSGQTFPQAIKTRYSLLTKYTFEDGPAKGAFVGTGIWGGTKSLQDYNGPNGAARYHPGRMEVDLFGGYRFKIGEDYDAIIQLNIKNALEEDDYVGWIPVAGGTATRPYKVPLSRVIRLTFGLDF